MKDKITLPQHFRVHGFKTMRSGKIFHRTYADFWDDHFPERLHYRPKPAIAGHKDFNGLASTMGRISQHDWAPIDFRDKETMDGKTASWAAEVLTRKQSQPFFLAVGTIRLHEPWYVPRKYFEMHPLDKIVLPPIQPNDLEDVPAEARAWAHDTNFYPSVIKIHSHS